MTKNAILSPIISRVGPEYLSKKHDIYNLWIKLGNGNNTPVIAGIYWHTKNCIPGNFYLVCTPTTIERQYAVCFYFLVKTTDWKLPYENEFSNKNLLSFLPDIPYNFGSYIVDNPFMGDRHFKLLQDTNILEFGKTYPYPNDVIRQDCVMSDNARIAISKNLGIEIKPVCKHEWVMYGFTSSSWCCKHCNMERPQ